MLTAINLLIKWRRFALPLAAGAFLLLAGAFLYRTGYNACSAKFKAKEQERTIKDYEILKEKRRTRLAGDYVKRLQDGQF